MTAYLFVLAVGLAAGCLSGIIGTGSSLMLLPVLVHTHGPKQAVPVMAVAAVMGNIARVAAWWSKVDWKAVIAYALTGVPAAALGARTLLALPAHAIEVALGLFFLAMIPLRRWHARSGRRLRLWHLSVAGALIGFLTGLVLSTGPLSVPVFASYGLTAGPLLATEGASALTIYLSKVVAFQHFGAMPLRTLVQGLLVGSSIMLGTYLGKAIVLRMAPKAYAHLLDALMLCSGLALLWPAWSGPLIDQRSSSSERSRTAPLSADITSLA